MKPADLITRQEAADLAGCGVWTIKAWVRAERLRHWLVGPPGEQRSMVSRAEVEALAPRVGCGAFNRDRARETYRAHHEAVLAALARGDSPTTAARAAGLQPSTVRAWASRDEAGVSAYAGFARRMRAAMSAPAEDEANALRAVMASVLDGMRRGRTMEQAATEAGTTKGAVRVWCDKGQDGEEPFTWFVGEYDRAREASRTVASRARAEARATRQVAQSRIRAGDRIYFIAAAHAPDVVKIGFTRDSPEIRMKFLQIGSPVRLAILAAVPGPMMVERWLHAAFRDERSHGEWFHLSPRIRSFMEAAVRAGRLATPSEAAVLLAVNASVRKSA